MRVLFTVSDWPGHYYPLVPLGRALQAAGHEVRVACAAGESAALRRAGLTPEPLLRPALGMAEQGRLNNYWAAQKGAWPYDRLPPHPVTGEELRRLEDFDFAAFRTTERPRILRATREGFDAVVGFARAWRPDLVVHDRMSIEGLLAARVLGVPAVLHLWGPHGTAEPEPELRIIPGDPTGSFPRYGAGEMGTDLIEYVLDPCPPGLEPPTDARRLRMRYVPYNGPGTAPRLEPPSGGRPRVCLVWGRSLAGVYGPVARLVPELAASCAATGAEVLVLADPEDTAALGTPPPGVRLLPGAPLGDVLPGCAAVVHHGGAGCTMTAVAAGVPQLGVPFSAEQHLNVRRVAGAGAGLVVPASDGDRPAAVRDALTRLLRDPVHRTRAARLREELAGLPGPAEIVPVLEDIALPGRAGNRAARPAGPAGPAPRAGRTATADATAEDPAPAEDTENPEEAEEEERAMPTQRTSTTQDDQPQDDQLQAETRIREIALSVAAASAIQVAVRLGVADALDDEDADARDLGRAVNAAPDTLARLLRALAAHGVFEETAPGRFRHTATSRLLRSDAPGGGMADMVLWAGAAWTWDAWPRLEQAVRTGKAVLPELYGKDFFSYLREDAPDDARVFNRAMTQASALTSRAVAETLDLDGAGSVADIGGGQGHLLRTILERHPHVTGELFDLPAVVEGADPALREGGELAGRARVTAGDCLDAVPVSADVYVIKQILKWDDERSVRVLRNVAEHAAPGARIVVVQNLVDLSPEPRVTTAMDLFLLLNVGGREHHQGDFEDLFRRAGLEFAGVTRARSALYLIEARVPGTAS
ncbi:methyltransferase [Streptomyces sp. TG1A-8]|uniref:methyltransferase n=1 Tax=Streptomyces sp. TG1A-8 TaxID=3051385 RepID=UPI00265C0621|nr:methyltransferase [Streptomyces sp. TG1A-8]MDO0926706.1 methyltransferase [Streptomyces sp. TG1A-8]